MRVSGGVLHRTPRRAGRRPHAASGVGISEMQQFNIQAFHRITTWFQNLKSSLRADGRDKHEERTDGGLIIRYVDDPVMAQELPKNARELQSSLRQLGTKLTSVWRLHGSQGRGAVPIVFNPDWGCRSGCDHDDRRAFVEWRSSGTGGMAGRKRSSMRILPIWSDLSCRRFVGAISAADRSPN
jgi:hypothetical protein